MTRPTVPRPADDEYGAFYAGYIAALGEEEVFSALEEQPGILRAACTGLPEERALHRYAPGKWSVKEVIGHLTDAERVFSYRAFRISRGDATPLPGFDENAYVAAAGSDRRPLEELLREFELARASTTALLRGLEPGAWPRRGVASGQEVTVRALAHIIPGHAKHHLRILRERYALDVPPGRGVPR